MRKLKELEEILSLSKELGLNFYNLQAIEDENGDNDGTFWLIYELNSTKEVDTFKAFANLFSSDTFVLAGFETFLNSEREDD